MKKAAMIVLMMIVIGNGVYLGQAHAVTYSLLHIEGDKFNPADSISRLEVAAVIRKCFAISDVNVPLAEMVMEYEDAEQLIPQDRGTLQYIGQAGIMRGYDSCFHPFDNLNRAQAACVFNRCQTILNGNVL
ncbi:MAG: S-layer homology domain-containing protein [Bacillota bacterium]|nr:S-layer homology domain-containing protein [Bacillota bacterium]